MGAASSTQTNSSNSLAADSNTFTVDSGATLHCINSLDLFETIYEDHPPVELTVANGQQIIATAVGTVRLKLLGSDGNYHDFLLDDTDDRRS